MGSTGSIPGQGTKTQHATQCGKKKKKKADELKNSKQGRNFFFSLKRD